MLVTLYLGISLLIYARQTRLIFFPSRFLEITPKDLGLVYEDVALPVPNGSRVERMHGWWLPARNPNAGVLLYLHGNGGNISGNLEHAVRFYQMGLSVLLIDYRGYGRSEGGFPSEGSVYRDAEVAWDYLVQQRQIPPHRILLYGHSLGGAIAIQLAIHQPEAAGLIVESSFSSMRDMTHRTTPFGLLPVDLILTQKFDSLRKVPALRMPVLFIHGIQDCQVPADMSEMLYQAAPEPKQLWLVPYADHNDVAAVAGAKFFQVVSQFIGELGLLAR